MKSAFKIIAALIVMGSTLPMQAYDGKNKDLRDCDGISEYWAEMAHGPKAGIFNNTEEAITIYTKIQKDGDEISYEQKISPGSWVKEFIPSIKVVHGVMQRYTVEVTIYCRDQRINTTLFKLEGERATYDDRIMIVDGQVNEGKLVIACGISTNNVRALLDDPIHL